MPDAAVLHAARAGYLERWRDLDDELQRRAGPVAELACFGAGEVAGLLRAYTPRLWSRIRHCIADAPERESFGGTPVVDYSGVSQRGTILLGTSPMTQPQVARRLADDGWHVIRWDDLVDQ